MDPWTGQTPTCIVQEETKWDMLRIEMKKRAIKYERNIWSRRNTLLKECIGEIDKDIHNEEQKGKGTFEDTDTICEAYNEEKKRREDIVILLTDR